MKNRPKHQISKNSTTELSLRSYKIITTIKNIILHIIRNEISTSILSRSVKNKKN